MKSLGHILKSFFFEFDAVTIRAILALGSMAFALILVIGGQPFTREAYSIMEAVGHEGFWTIAFLLHTAGTLWRILDPVARPRWAVAFNAYGVFIWFFTTLSICIAVGYLPPSMALNWIVVGLAGWALFRTARYPEKLTP